MAPTGILASDPAKDDSDTTRYFVHLSRDWSSQEVPLTGNLIDEVRISDRQGHDILVRWRALSGNVMARLEVEEDSFPSLAGWGEVMKLLSRLSAEYESISPEVFCFELTRLGLTDATQHASPGHKDDLQKNASDEPVYDP
jgi:hypothetical protein